MPLVLLGSDKIQEMAQTPRPVKSKILEVKTFGDS